MTIKKSQTRTVYGDVTTYRFKAGPYIPPRAGIGAILVDAELGGVEVVGFTKALIPWPACIDRGRTVPILTGGLVRAVLEEPAGTVAHYFGVTRYHVNCWRRALAGVKGWTEVHSKLAQLRLTPKIRARYGYRSVRKT